MRRKRVLVLMHEDLVPPDDIAGRPDAEVSEYKTEYDVVTGLRDLGHEVQPLGLYDDLAPLRGAIQDLKPHIVFNLLEEFRGEPMLDHHVVSYLELVQAPYTGCNPRGLMIARDKALSKMILHHHRIRVPRFAVVPAGRKLTRKPARLDYPLIVKSQVAEASFGIAEASIVYNLPSSTMTRSWPSGSTLCTLRWGPTSSSSSMWMAVSYMSASWAMRACRCCRFGNSKCANSV